MATAPSALALNVGNPPAVAGTSFVVKLKGARGPLALYLSPSRKPVKGDISLGPAHAHHGKVRIRITRKVKPGGYYVLACTGSKRHPRCSASRHSTAVIPKPSASVGVNGTATLAPASANTTGTLGSGGGAVTATGPDGTTYTLAFRSGAVEDGTQITLTPLTGMSAKGLGSFVAGVYISVPAAATPSLLQGGILVIKPAHAVAVADRVGVTFSASGTAINAIPVVDQASPIVIPVYGAGGYALFNSGGVHSHVAHALRRAGLERRQPGLERPHDGASGADDAGFYEQLISGMLHSLLADGASPEDGSATATSYQDAVVSALNDWYSDIIGSEVPGALQSDAAAQQTISDLAAWAQTGSVAIGDGRMSAGSATGIDNRYSGMSDVYGPNWEQDKVVAVLKKIADAGYDRAQAACASNYDLTRLPVIVGWYQIASVSGNAVSLSVQDVYACANFIVDFDSTMLWTFSAAASGDWDNEYTATVHIGPNASGVVTGTGTGSYMEADGTDTLTTPCGGSGNVVTTSTDSGGAGTEFDVPTLTLPSAGAPVLTIHINSPTENYVDSSSGCGHSTGPTTTPIDNWAEAFRSSHHALATQPGFNLTLTPGSGSTYGTWKSQGTVSDTSAGNPSVSTLITEDTQVAVTFNPQPYPKL
jgi:hypothetical protein